jgi:ATP-dependent RNA helicase DeaD
MKKEERPSERESRSDRYGDRNDRKEKSGRDGREGDRREKRERTFDGKSSDKRGSRRRDGMVRLFVNVGKMDRVSAGDLVGAFTGEANIDSNQIGMIEIYDKYSFVEVSDNSVNDVMDGMSNSRIKGRKVNIEIANPKG